MLGTVSGIEDRILNKVERKNVCLKRKWYSIDLNNSIKS